MGIILRNYHCKAKITILLPQPNDNLSGEAQFTRLLDIHFDNLLTQHFDNLQVDSLYLIDRKIELTNGVKNSNIFNFELDLITTKPCDCADALESSFESMANAQRALLFDSTIAFIRDQVRQEADSLSALELFLSKLSKDHPKIRFTNNILKDNPDLSPEEFQFIKKYKIHERLFNKLLEKQAELGIEKASYLPNYRRLDPAQIVFNRKTYLSRFN